jgi:phage shock protein A
VFKFFRMVWRGIKNALFERVSPELMAQEAKDEIRQSTLETVQHAQAAEVQAVKAERLLAQLMAEREKARIGVKRALKAGNELQANLFAEQVARLDQRIAAAKERVEHITAGSRNARLIATQRVQQMALRQLEIDGYVADIHLAAVEKQMAAEGQRMIGLLRDSRTEAYDRLRERAEQHTAEATAASRVTADILAGSAAQAELEMRTPSDEAEQILAEVRAELGMAQPQAKTALPAPDSIEEEEGEDMVKNILKESV